MNNEEVNMNHPLEGEVIRIHLPGGYSEGHAALDVPPDGQFQLIAHDGRFRFEALTQDWPAGWNGAEFDYVPGPLLASDIPPVLQHGAPGGEEDGYAHYRGVVTLHHVDTAGQEWFRPHTAYIVVGDTQHLAPRVVVWLERHEGGPAHGGCSHGDPN
jgi:hypothetical protein